ncbi:MAG: FG-GAP repeat protein [Verrucomicrobiae bacterium]|nr:FG-GAP repeat protein [Verrucomicrobiae bacterium]MCP5543145.1 FG-GAP repeat protein [Akkermansiaceae bacterium]
MKRHQFRYAGMVLSMLLTASTAWSQRLAERHKLVPSDAEANDRFGESLAISGSTIVAGAPRNSADGYLAGAVYAFHAETGKQLVKFKPKREDMTDFDFGASVAINGQMAVVGAPSGGTEPFPSAITYSGVAYLFDVRTGNEIVMYAAPDRAGGDRFGASVGISGEFAVVGAPWDDPAGRDSGSAYVFRADSGAFVAKLTPRDGAEYANFGEDIGISGSTVVVGAKRDAKSPITGTAYLFDARTGAQKHKLVPKDDVTGTNFGSSVAISGNRAIVGAYTFDKGGRAYVFNVATGKQMMKLIPNDPSQFKSAGFDVSISGNLAILGAPGDTVNGTNSGAAYIFDLTTGCQVAKIRPSDGAKEMRFGWAVAIDGNTSVVGTAPPFGSIGAAYVYSGTMPTCTKVTGPNKVKFSGKSGSAKIWILSNAGIRSVKARATKAKVKITGRNPYKITVTKAKKKKTLVNLTVVNDDGLKTRRTIRFIKKGN